MIKDVKKYAEEKGIITKEVKLKITDGKIFNPDELKLTIDDIKLWFEHKQKTSKSKFAKMFYMGLKRALLIFPEESILNFWHDAVKDFNELIIKNSLSHAEGNGETWAESYKKIMQTKEDEIEEIRKKENKK